MSERTGELTFQGNALTLLGTKRSVGDTAPDFTLLDNGLGAVTLASSAGKVRLISVVPSLDTGVCDAQTRRFNEEVSKLGDGVIVYTVSADLPFGQGRWCGAAGVERVQTLSDHYDMNFADAYGVHIKELRLDTRAVFVVDASDKITYVEYVPEMTDPPNYKAALEALTAAAG